MQELQETQVWSLGQEDTMEKGMVTHSSILVWRIPWTEEPGGLQSMEVAKSQTQLKRLSTHARVSGQKECSVPESIWRELWEGKGYPLQYSGLENSMDTVHGVAKSQTELSDFHFLCSRGLMRCQALWNQRWSVSISSRIHFSSTQPSVSDRVNTNKYLLHKWTCPSYTVSKKISQWLILKQRKYLTR